MKRREFITALGGVAAGWPLVVRAQQGGPPRRIAILLPYFDGDPEGKAVVAAFKGGLEGLGWTEGRNIRFDIRWAGGDPDKARTFAKELVAMAPDVIVPSSNLVTTIMQQETRSIPIVFILVGDPVGSGYVASMAQPGGNLTGFAVLENAIAGKWVQILQEIAPTLSRVGFMLHPETPANVGLLRAAEAGAPSTVKLIALGVHSTAEIERAVTEFAAEGNGGLIVAPHAITFANREPIIDLAARFRLPAVYAFRTFAASGGLISYGTNPLLVWREGASSVDRILRGAKPADLPAQFPTKYELVINLKTAKTLGLTVPPLMLGRADDVIE
ncbi:MAG: ABC transporter substrate-binding protein [Steroidobacteraceae bacterium]|jgi:putative tryptophan/tyrosine transport system substrate-binding protein